MLHFQIKNAHFDLVKGKNEIINILVIYHFIADGLKSLKMLCFNDLPHLKLKVIFELLLLKLVIIDRIHGISETVQYFKYLFILYVTKNLFVKCIHYMDKGWNKAFVYVIIKIKLYRCGIMQYIRGFTPFLFRFSRYLPYIPIK